MWRYRYRYGLILLAATIWALSMYAYKNRAFEEAWRSAKEQQKTLRDLKRLIAYKTLWQDNADKPETLTRLETVLSSRHFTLTKKGKKLTARVEKLASKDLDNVVTNILRMPVKIKTFDLRRLEDGYFSVELVCVW